MSVGCNTDKFIINKGMSNDFILKIKQNGNTLPMQIEPSDTFICKLFALGTDVKVFEEPATIYDASNGQIKIVFGDNFVQSLEGEVGGKEDRYYLKPTYRLAIECSTVNNGTFIAKIPLVYVRN